MKLPALRSAAFAFLLSATFGFAQAPAPPPFTVPSPEVVQRILKELPEIDADKDGKLTRPELNKFLPQLQRRGLLMAAFGAEPTATNVHYGPHERNVLDFWKAN